MKRILKACFSLVLAAGMLVSAGTTGSAADASPEWTRYPLIAHALGGIDGVDYTNSRQAFTRNYDKGHRVFEIDLSLTEDGQLVGRHDWMRYLAQKLDQEIPQEKLDEPLTLREFKSYKILDKYTPLSFKDVAQILHEHPDVYFITDTKETDPELVKQQFTIIRDTVEQVDPAILDRLIPEIYTPQMMDTVKGIIPFKNVIFSLYLTEMTPDEIVRYVQNNQIRVVAMPPERAQKQFLQDLNNVGAVNYVHSINEAAEVKRLMDNGVHGVYTDFLSYQDLGIDPTPLYAAAAKAANDSSGNEVQKLDAGTADAGSSPETQDIATGAPPTVWDRLKGLFAQLLY
ncbi:phosphatidylinositol-specific phospholipase C/glycerophosphodiester phosphodiesterase family protein [Paenibacillus xerothermodurans]|uniref:GP-PDE domain-containing protein n=1 Tax=Paenibacillus xerothermodurans TaxID=1977292 RepID=A0A2W1NTX3_PAEXE|nr:phosphatidylinositol-specific phospholipase C/glycerophosphodiester phosphodiesterase family protein [Paenibacillus xerothermodurans]PZE22093.1 hypothetical protein CBW46_006800 [Paenibacillus xerothermodurans]